MRLCFVVFGRWALPFENHCNILQVNTRDVGGGAEKVAADLFCAYRSLGYGSRLAVGYKSGDDPDVLRIPHDEAGSAGARLCWSLHRHRKISGIWGI